jgi:multicomponent Na+:H+ antiporter subunit A
LIVAMLASLAAVLLLAAAAPWVGRPLGRSAGVVFSIVPFAIVAWMLSSASGVLSGEAVRESHAWAGAVGLSLSFSLDGLSLLFGLLICGVGGLILIYADAYLDGDPRRLRLHSFLLLFMAAMLGVVWSENLLALFIFWELTSVSSYLLIGFDHRRVESRRSALQALLVTGAGGLALLVGVLMLGGIAGSYEIPAVFAESDSIVRHRLFIPILILFVVGAFAKSACFPFHFWLPGAMAAPTPVSAYLHSSTMVKAGIYLLARMAPLFAAAAIWGPLLTGTGAVTMLVGAVLAMRERDLKRLLAYSTVSSLGLIVMAIGIGSPAALAAGVAYLLAHALFKGSLFMVAGAIDHGCGERDAERLGGLRAAMPALFIASLLAAASMAGLPPLLGFIAKEAVLEHSLHAPLWGSGLFAATIAAAGITVAISLLAGVKPFIGRSMDAPGDTPHEPHAPSAGLLLGPAALAGLGAVLGILPFLASPLVSSAASAAAAEPVEARLSLWHGFNMALAGSVVAIAAGLVLYRFREPCRRGLWRLRFLDRIGPQAAYEGGLRGLVALAEGQTRFFQSGHLRSYVFITVGTAVGLVGYSLWSLGGVQIDLGTIDIRWHEALIAAVIAIAAVAASTARSRITAVAALGLAGFGVAVMFVMYGAPDLAMTQIAIETLTVILFVLIFRRLPDFRTISTGLQRAADTFMSVAAGALVAALVLVAAGSKPNLDAAKWFGANSYVGGHGRNVVNVILVDFRALDTLGEITVLAIAAIGVFALLRPGRMQSRE